MSFPDFSAFSGHLKWRNIEALAKAYTAMLVAKQRPVIYLCPTEEDAETTLQNLRFLFGTQDQNLVLHLPANERTPYHQSSPDPLVVMERMVALHQIATGAAFQVLVLSAKAAATYLPALQDLQHQAELLEVGLTLDRHAFIQKLSLMGYSQVNLVEDPGTYAVRGSIIDIFWAGMRYPVRVDLFGDEIETLKLFEPSTQRTVQKIEHYSFGAAKEIALSKAAVQHATQKLRDLADEVEYPTKKLKEKLADLANQIPFFGIESLLPAFHERLTTPLELLFHTMGTKPILIADDLPQTLTALSEAQKDNEEHYRAALVRGDLCYPVASFLQPETEFNKQLQAFAQLEYVSSAHPEACPEGPITSTPTNSLRQDILRETMRTDDESHESSHFLLAPLVKRLKQAHQDKTTVLLPVASTGGTHRLRELLSPHGLHIQALKEPLSLWQNPLPTYQPGIQAYTYVASPEPPAEGAYFNAIRLLILAEDDIFGKRARKDKSTGKKKGFKTDLSDLEPDDYIVHVDHGVGQFKGLTRLTVRGVEQDYVLVHFAGDDKLYLPVHRINLIQRYSGAEGKAPKLDKLGGPGWQSKKTKVKEAVLAMAQELLHLYAKRELIKRSSFPAPDGHYWEFEARFGFETTPDQQKAIDDVLRDMQGQKPMDRLICGDVGYGKTEVAMRAAMLAVVGGQQVAVLAPTTVLAQQHGITFTERFSGSAANIAVVSRFQKPAEIKEILAKVQAGKIDILIGTHRILSDDVSFKKLGLVIVDEEQRFGIKAKEQLKRLRHNVDFLTLSATPIPRTLQMGFFGIRDLSVIETPPVDRRAIRTQIARFDDGVIREAVLRELSRGGQVYFVHNRVSSIQATADYLRRLVPEAKIEVGHGQMDESALEDVMVRFMKHEFNVLVCTTIIETGIDVPTANTMFIDDADNFGLAQLYQLRGRIGRSKERAFAYLLIPADVERLTPIAQKRLEILNRFSELGAGFRIAQHDLELRGAGDLLGKNQHGHMAAVGYDLYVDLLKEAVEELRGQTHEDIPDPEVALPFAAMIPDSYCPDLQERLSFYQRLATAQTSDEIWETVGAMNDLLGDAPQPVLHLAEVMILKQELRTIAARGVELLPSDDKNPLPRIAIALGNSPKLNPAKLTAFVEDNRQRVLLTPKMKLIYTPLKQEWEVGNLCNLFALAKSVVRQLGCCSGV